MYQVTGEKYGLGIPCVRDRVVQATIKYLLEPIIDPTFSENSYGQTQHRQTDSTADWPDFAMWCNGGWTKTEYLCGNHLREVH